MAVEICVLGRSAIVADGVAAEEGRFGDRACRAAIERASNDRR